MYGTCGPFEAMPRDALGPAVKIQGGIDCSLAHAQVLQHAQMMEVSMRHAGSGAQ